MLKTQNCITNYTISVYLCGKSTDMLNYFNTKSNETVELTVINMISKGTSIIGNMTCGGDLRIDGSLEGNITTQGKLVTGSDSEIRGDIKVESAVIGGIIMGNITATGTLEIEKSSSVEGVIISNGLIIHEGADLKAEICSRNKSIQKPLDSKVVHKTRNFSKAAVL